jgi:hypothetical protein
LNRILSGVLTPDWREGEGGAREEVEWVGEGMVVNEDWCVGERSVEEICEVGGREETEDPIVVLRCRLVVSLEGGGGRWFAMVCEERMEARQRKHSPVPK